MKRIAATIALALLVHAQRADACTTGGSSGSLNLGGSSDSSDGTASCTDVTDVVGYRQCTKFGAWGVKSHVPLLIFELGLSVQSFADPVNSGGTLSHDGEQFAYRVTSGGPSETDHHRTTAVVSNLRVGVGITHGLYIAGELEIGGLASDPSRSEMVSTGKSGSPELTQTSTIAFGGMGVLGFQHSIRQVLLAAELVGGGRAITYNYKSKYRSCEQDVSVITGRPVLEARARASMWVSPMVSVGVQAGSSLIGTGEWNGGVFLGGYTRAFAR